MGTDYSQTVGSGCKQRPLELDKIRKGPASVAGLSLGTLEDSSLDGTLAKSFNIEGWSGFCEMGWSLCPDAKVNKDYMYYAKGLGTRWATKHKGADEIYCGLNGWL